jgi:hypothetical protein
MDTYDEEKLELFPFLFFLSVLFPFILLLGDYYKFANSYPFCRQAFLSSPMDFNFLQHVDALWRLVGGRWGDIPFPILHCKSPSLSHLLHPSLFFLPRVRGMKYKFDTISQLHLLTVSLSHDILLLFAFTLTSFFKYVLVFLCISYMF